MDPTKDPFLFFFLLKIAIPAKYQTPIAYKKYNTSLDLTIIWTDSIELPLTIHSCLKPLKNPVFSIVLITVQYYASESKDPVEKTEREDSRCGH